MNSRKVVQIINMHQSVCHESVLLLEQAQIGNQPQLQTLTVNTTGDPRYIYLYGSLKNLT